MSATVAVDKIRQPTSQLPFLLRVVWFFVIGWEVTGVWILIAWFLNATIIGLPVGLWMINRVPQVLTLKARAGAWEYDLKSGRSHYIGAKQAPWLLRALYFLFIGWWFSLVWAAVAWLLCVTILGLPLGVIMLHSLPFITTLRKG